MNKEIYCYNIDDMDQHVLNRIAASLNIDIYLLDDGMLNKTVEEILNHQQPSNQDCTRFDSSLVLTNNLSEKEEEELFDQARAFNQSIVPAKISVDKDLYPLTLSTLLHQSSVLQK